MSRNGFAGCKHISRASHAVLALRRQRLSEQSIDMHRKPNPQIVPCDSQYVRKLRTRQIVHIYMQFGMLHRHSKRLPHTEGIQNFIFYWTRNASRKKCTNIHNMNFINTCALRLSPGQKNWLKLCITKWTLYVHICWSKSGVPEEHWKGGSKKKMDSKRTSSAQDTNRVKICARRSCDIPVFSDGIMREEATTRFYK